VRTAGLQDDTLSQQGTRHTALHTLFQAIRAITKRAVQMQIWSLFSCNNLILKIVNFGGRTKVCV